MFEVSTVSEDRLALVGRLDASQVDKAEKAFGALQQSTTLDCAELQYISSAGLGAIVGVQKRLQQAGHRLVLVNLSPHVRNVFHYAGLDTYFDLK
jgi:anti-anti-sigma factor